MMGCDKRIVLVAVVTVAAVLSIASTARRAECGCDPTIGQETFTAADGTNLAGRRPDGWHCPDRSFVGFPETGSGDATVQSNQAHLAADYALAIDISGPGRHDWFWVEARMNLGDSDRVGVGFYSQPGQSVTENFTGLVLDRSGQVRLLVDGAETSHTYQCGPAFDPGAFHQFYLDVSPGVDAEWQRAEFSITNGPGGYLPASLFTQANTAYAGFFVSSSNQGAYGYVDDFSVWWIPEPASAAILCLIGPALLKRRRSWVAPPHCRG